MHVFELKKRDRKNLPLTLNWSNRVLIAQSSENIFSHNLVAKKNEQKSLFLNHFRIV